ncbi:MAG TPA: hypothetical protein VGF12_09240, partial [Roseateles sp.]
NLVHDLYNHLQYGWLFALGWASRTPLAEGLWSAALRLRWAALGISLASWAVLMAFNNHYALLQPPEGVLDAARTLRGALGWWAIVAACGWAQRAFTRESPGLRQASQAVFCLYILHQSVIVLLSQWMRPLDLPWGLEAVLLIVLTFAACGAAYLVLRRVPGLALLVGIQHRAREQQAQPSATSSAAPAS